MIKDWTKIESLLKLPKGSILKAVEAEEEKDIELPELIIRTQEEESSFVENTKQTVRDGFDTNAGLEIAVKKQREKLGLEFEGKTLSNLLAAYEKKIKADANTEPNTIIEEKERQLELLKTQISTIESERDGYQSSLTEFKNSTTIDSALRSLMPDNIAIPTEDMLMLFKNKHNISVDNGVMVFNDASGNKILDPTTAGAVDPNSIVSSFFQGNQHYLKSPEGGAGGGDSSGGVRKQTLEEFHKEMTDSGVNMGTNEYVGAMSERQAAGKLED